MEGEGRFPLPPVPTPETSKFSIWLFHRTDKDSAQLCFERMFWLTVLNATPFNCPTKHSHNTEQKGKAKTTANIRQSSEKLLTILVGRETQV